MAAAKHRPMYLRLRSSQRLKCPGNSTCREDAAKAMYSQGTEQRTESWIMAETPGPSLKSLTVMATIMAAEIGAVTSQNSPHLFKAPLVSTSFRSLLMAFGHTSNKRVPSSLVAGAVSGHPVV